MLDPIRVGHNVSLVGSISSFGIIDTAKVLIDTAKVLIDIKKVLAKQYFDII